MKIEAEVTVNRPIEEVFSFHDRLLSNSRVGRARCREEGNDRGTGSGGHKDPRC